jgi:lysophospholipase L1-like esterase
MQMNPRRPMLPLLPVALALITGCTADVAPTEFTNPAAGKTVLFIGNSLTYYNDVPVLVQGIADAAGGDSLIIAMVAGPDMALVDHWNGGNARDRIQAGHWDYVVLQQGPSSTTINRDSLRLVAKLFEPSITGDGGKPVLFSAWPNSDRRADFPRAAESYRLAAEDVGGLYAPVAAAWIEAWNRDPNLDLYSDGLHANPVGSYLAALVIYSRITGKSPVGLPSTIRLRNGTSVSFSAALTTLLQESAWAAVSPILTP